MITTSITLPEALHHQAKILAEQLGISPDDVWRLALEQFLQQHVQLSGSAPPNEIEQASDPITRTAERKLNQGDIYWLQPAEMGEEIHHPHVIVQENIFNHSRIHTVIVCALTSNLKRAAYPGNVLLEAKEGNLPKQSVVEISKVSSVDKAQLGGYIGSLSEPRIHQILAGMRFLHSSFFTR